uniref:Exocyst complex component 6 n=1 Tax=Hymenolepis diminuta TaxID=6216 RepID=A0A158QF27_HYMDI
LTRNSSKNKLVPDSVKYKALTHESLYAARTRADDTFSIRTPTTVLSNHQSFSRVLSRHTSVSTASALAVDCGTIGLQTLNKVVDQVDECIGKINRSVQQLTTEDPSVGVLIEELQKFLETSILLREQFKRAFIQETPVSASDLQCIDSLSDVDNESFFSTVEEIDYSELELQILSNYHRPLYRNALKEINESSPVCKALLGYLDSLHDPDSRAQFADELACKGVQALNFYDIFFDRILIDALENLGNPPQSIYTLTRNTWLSPSFKRSALDSAVWTLMAAKQKMLKYPEGFFALYYRVVETVTAALAWGFLGTDESLNTFCDAIREEVVTFLRSLFKFADNYDDIISDRPPASHHNNEEDEGDVDGTSSSAFLDFGEDEVSCENEDDDDVTLTPEGEKASSELAEHQFYRGMNYANLEAFSACIYANASLLHRRLASLITDFAVNNSIQIPTSVRNGLNLTQPPLSSCGSDV